MKKILVVTFASLLVFVITSCRCNTSGKKDINCEYPGGIIYEKESYGNLRYHIKYEGEVYDVQAYVIFQYNIGDTIDGPCEGHKESIQTKKEEPWLD